MCEKNFIFVTNLALREDKFPACLIIIIVQVFFKYIYFLANVQVKPTFCAVFEIVNWQF